MTETFSNFITGAPPTAPPLPSNGFIPVTISGTTYQCPANLIGSGVTSINTTAPLTGGAASGSGGTIGLSLSGDFSIPSGILTLANNNYTLGATTVTLGTTLSALIARGPNALNIDQMTTYGDVNQIIPSTVRVAATNAALTTTRTWTLPAASALNAGQELAILDRFGGVTAGNTLTIARVGADLINGATTYVMNATFAALVLVSDGSAKWTIKNVPAPTAGGSFTLGSTTIALGSTVGTIAGTVNYSGTLQQGGSQVFSAVGGALTSSGPTVSLTTPISTANGGTNHGTFTTGSIVYASDATHLSEDNANFFWDGTNHRLGLGTTSPVAQSRATVAGSSISVTGVDGGVTAGGERAFVDYNSGTHKARIGAIQGGGTAPSLGLVSGNGVEQITISSAGAVKLNTGYGAGVIKSDASGNLTSSAFAPPTTTVFNAGSGTYTTPANVVWLEIEMVGGGSGGGGGNGGTPPGAGGNTTFGALSAGGATGVSVPGSASGGDININGSYGGPGSFNILTNAAGTGGAGGPSAFGGAGSGVYDGPGFSAQAGSGSGGGGGGVDAVGAYTLSGTGGSSGAYLKKIIGSPAATYTYAVGAAGGAGTGGTSGYPGGAGGSGLIRIVEHYS